MASDRQIELRLSRLENDTNSIYDLVTDIKSTQDEHSRRFDAVDQRFDTADQRFDVVDQRFDAVDRHFDSVEATLTEVVRRLPEPS
jgi:chromosome segregation ATPase